MTGLKKMHWSVIDNPFRNKAPIAYGLYDKENLLAFVSFTYLPFIVNDHIEIVASYGDFFASSNCPLKEILRFANTHIKKKPTPVIVGLHASEATNAIWKRHGAKVIYGSEKTYTKLISQKNRILYHLARFSNKTITASHFQEEITVKGFRCYLLSYDAFEKFDEDIEHLFTLQNKHIKIATLRNTAYLTWRYLHSPFADSYYFIKVFDGDTLIGFSVIQKKNTDSRICEFVYSHNDENNREILLTALMLLAKRLGCVSVVTKINSPADEDFWIKRKFTATKKSYEQFLLIGDMSCEANEPLSGLFSYGDFKLV